IPYLPSRVQLISSGNEGRATQNAARAILAKVYLYQKKWSDAMAMTTEIINSGDNNLSTPYAEMFTEANEYGPESVFEVYADQKPSEQIYLSTQYGQIQGVRGIPNLGWGFNGPSQLLMDAYEAGDPRKTATVIADGETIEGKKIKADAAGYKFFNKKVYVSLAERALYGRSTDIQAYWLNIRLIRYADVLLMHAEAACEVGNTTEALDKLEMVRNRARNGNSNVLPKITTTNKEELRAKIHQERRIELALEWERFYDLVRWDEAKAVIPNFVSGKHELFPIPQIEIDNSEGLITQNPGY
nr:RagB/SusD family nutrient uptake outer membrane protein [Paludibacter sp.]